MNRTGHKNIMPDGAEQALCPRRNSIIGCEFKCGVYRLQGNGQELNMDVHDLEQVQVISKDVFHRKSDYRQFISYRTKKVIYQSISPI